MPAYNQYQTPSPPIPYYLSKKIYAYYESPTHIKFDEELTMLLKKKIIGYRDRTNHIAFK